MKMHIIVSKRLSKKGSTYLYMAIKVGSFGKFDGFFPSAVNVQALTGLSIDELEKAECGVLLDKEVEV